MLRARWKPVGGRRGLGRGAVTFLAAFQFDRSTSLTSKFWFFGSAGSFHIGFDALNASASLKLILARFSGLDLICAALSVTTTLRQISSM